MSQSLWVPALAHATANASPGLAFYLSSGMSGATYIGMVMAIFLLAAIGAGIHLRRREREKTDSVI